MKCSLNLNCLLRIPFAYKYGICIKMHVNTDWSVMPKEYTKVCICTHFRMYMYASYIVAVYMRNGR